MKKTKKVFRSRISVLLIGFIPTVMIFTSMSLLSYTNEKLYIYILGGTLLFIIFLFSGIRYIISENMLYVKTWFIPCGKMNIMDVVSMKRSYNLISSPATSLKRLQICFVKGSSWLVSPVREQEFIKELKSINPNIDINVTDRKGIWRIWDWDI